MQDKKGMRIMDNMNPACVERKNMKEFSFSGRVLE